MAMARPKSTQTRRQACFRFVRVTLLASWCTVAPALCLLTRPAVHAQANKLCTETPSSPTVSFHSRGAKRTRGKPKSSPSLFIAKSLYNKPTNTPTGHSSRGEQASHLPRRGKLQRSLSRKYLLPKCIAKRATKETDKKCSAPKRR